MKKNKRITSLIVALAMVISAVGITTSAPVFSASGTQYVKTQAAGYDGKPKEKVGQYYIWVEDTYDENGNVTSSKLKCAESLKEEAKILKTVKTKNKCLDPKVITNGSTIYYAVNSIDKDKAVIYKTTVKGATAKKIKTVGCFFGLAACYNGRIYYNKGVGPANTPMDRAHLYSCKTSGKQARLEKKDYVVSSSYGKYMTGGGLTFDVNNNMQYLYNAKTRKAKKLHNAAGSAVYGKTVYYYTYSYLTAEHSNKWSVKKCSLSGKNAETIKTVKNIDLVYFGNKTAYFMDYSTDSIKKLTYKTKKLTEAK